MSDLIDRYELIKKTSNVKSGNIDAVYLKFCIYEAPKVDAVEVVRCKDCKHRTQGGLCPMCRHSDGSMRLALDDEFCSMGLRKDEVSE